MAEGLIEHARDIPDERFLAAVQRTIELRPGLWATRWDLANTLGGREWAVALYAIADASPNSDYTFNIPEGVDIYDVPGVPAKVALAKAKRLIKRGLLNGCACGCRGDFELTDAGRELLG